MELWLLELFLDISQGPPSCTLVRSNFQEPGTNQIAAGAAILFYENSSMKLLNIIGPNLAKQITSITVTAPKTGKKLILSASQPKEKTVAAALTPAQWDAVFEMLSDGSTTVFAAVGAEIKFEGPEFHAARELMQECERYAGLQSSASWPSMMQPPAKTQKIGTWEVSSGKTKCEASTGLLVGGVQQSAILIWHRASTSSGPAERRFMVALASSDATPKNGGISAKVVAPPPPPSGFRGMIAALWIDAVWLPPMKCDPDRSELYCLAAYVNIGSIDEIWEVLEKGTQVKFDLGFGSFTVPTADIPAVRAKFKECEDALGDEPDPGRIGSEKK